MSTKSTGALNKIRDLMADHGLTIADIDAYVGKKRGRKASVTVAPTRTVEAKYRDPKTGATWSGRGRAPGWIASARDRSRYLIAESEVAITKATSVAKKAGNYVRGPQPAKYRDPASGETWSGRGRAPAWLAGVKNRDAFLIDATATQAPEVPKGSAAKASPVKAASRKQAAKKAATTKSVPVSTKRAKKVVAKRASVKAARTRKAVSARNTVTPDTPVSAAATEAAEVSSQA